MEIFGLGIFAALVLALFSFGVFVFKLWMVIEICTRESSEGNDKIVWLLVALVVPFGELLYFLVRRPRRIQEFGR
ncbi:MAG: PLDc N-terminal domain-containing protein [Planctomycetota bacterium]|jgi:hypothetical protein